MFNIALGIFVLISPILFLPLRVPELATLQFYQFGFFTNNIEVVQRQIFMYSIVLLIFFSLFNKPKRVFGDVYLKWVFLSCIWSVYWHPMSIKIFPTVFLGFILYYLVSVCANVKNLRNFFMVIILVSFVNSFFAVLQFFHIHFLLYKESEIIGLMAYKSQLGIYQALALPICYILNPWLSIIPTIGLLLSNSGTAMFSAIVGMIYLLWKKGLRIQSIPFWQVFFIILGVNFYWHFGKLEIRFVAWIESIRIGIFNIFKGNGIGMFNFTVPYGNHYPFKYTDPYNIYLEVFSSIGIFGFLGFIFFIISKFIRIKSDNPIHQALISSCLVLVVSGLGYSFMDYPRLAGTAIVLFGFLTAIKKDGEKCL